MIGPRPLDGHARIYVAGPMRQYTHSNFEAFHAASAWLRSLGWTAFSPAENAIECGYDPVALNLTGPPDALLTVNDLKTFIMWDLNAVAESDAIFLLYGWGLSRGATLELRLAEFLERTVLVEKSNDFRDWGSREMVMRKQA